jgi:hypothetical protein
MKIDEKKTIAERFIEFVEAQEPHREFVEKYAASGHATSEELIDLQIELFRAHYPEYSDQLPQTKRTIVH